MPAKQRQPWFHFKQFRVVQARAAMRVTTHACVLGAWAPVDGCKRVLDIGTGTGLLSLMLAQRSTAHIDAVELEPSAALDARENFEDSPWSSRLHLHEMPIQLFESPLPYDCIVSNPPFFSGGQHNQDSKLALARHEGGLHHDELLAAIARLLSDDGRAHILLPADAATTFMRQALGVNLYLQARLDIRSLPTRPHDRVIISLGRQPAKRIALDALCLHDAYPQYSEAYIALMHNFHPHL